MEHRLADPTRPAQKKRLIQPALITLHIPDNQTHAHRKLIAYFSSV